MSLKMEVVEERSNVFLVRLEGSLDSGNYIDLEKKLDIVIDDDTKALVLDMHEVDYVSSAGIRTVMWAMKNLKARNATFSMIRMQPKIKNIFDTMKLLPILDIFDDMPQADEFIDQIINEELAR